MKELIAQIVEFFAAHTVEAIGIIVAAITAVGVFVGPWFASCRQRKSTGRDRKLRAHFEELKKEARLIISSAAHVPEITETTDDSGEIGVTVTVGAYGQIVKSIEEAQVSGSFKAHFREQVKEFNRLKQKIREHNAKCEDFRQKIKTAFESKGIPVGYQDALSAYIHEDAFKPLFHMWEELARGKHPWPDFQKIEFEPIYNMKGASLLYASGWKANAVAFAMTAADSEKCKAVLAEVAENQEDQKEAAEIFDSANKLIGEAKEFVGRLVTELNDMDNFWPGKKTNTFKELKKTCPGCRELF